MSRLLKTEKYGSLFQRLTVHLTLIKNGLIPHSAALMSFCVQHFLQKNRQKVLQILRSQLKASVWSYSQNLLEQNILKRCLKSQEKKEKTSKKKLINFQMNWKTVRALNTTSIVMSRKSRPGARCSKR